MAPLAVLYGLRVPLCGTNSSAIFLFLSDLGKGT